MEQHSFQEVMRQWGRYCKGYSDNHNDDCAGCPFEMNGSCNSYAKDNAQYAEQIERHVMSWALENPEPIYPKWCDWLAEQGILVCDNTYPNMRYWYALNKQKVEQPIPADIAQKLGLEPKE